MPRKFRKLRWLSTSSQDLVNLRNYQCECIAETNPSAACWPRIRYPLIYQRRSASRNTVHVKTGFVRKFNRELLLWTGYESWGSLRKKPLFYSSLVEKIKSPNLHFSHVWKMCILKEACNWSNFGWLIRQMPISQRSGRQTFCRRLVPGSLFVSPCPPECYLQSETKIEPDLR